MARRNGMTETDAKTLAALHRSEVLAEMSGVGKGASGRAINLKHGLLANRIATSEERDIFFGLVERFEEDFDLNASVDFMQVELVSLYFLQLGRCVVAMDWENAERLDRMLRANLRDLKATKRAREGDLPKEPNSSPSEWATALLERVAAATAAGQEAARLQAATPKAIE